MTDEPTLTDEEILTTGEAETPTQPGDQDSTDSDSDTARYTAR